MRNDEVTGWAGWVAFAGILLILRGIVQGLAGLGALLKGNFLIATQNHAVLVNNTAWGWIHLIVGVIVLFAGFSVLHGNTFGRIIAVIATIAALVVNLDYISFYPIWAIVLCVVDVLILYALIVHGSELKQLS